MPGTRITTNSTNQLLKRLKPCLKRITTNITGTFSLLDPRWGQQRPAYGGKLACLPATLVVILSVAAASV